MTWWMSGRVAIRGDGTCAFIQLRARAPRMSSLDHRLKLARLLGCICSRGIWNLEQIGVMWLGSSLFLMAGPNRIFGLNAHQSPCRWDAKRSRGSLRVRWSVCVLLVRSCPLSFPYVPGHQRASVLWLSEAGHQHIIQRCQLHKKIPKYVSYNPHDDILDGIHFVMDGSDGINLACYNIHQVGQGRTHWTAQALHCGFWILFVGHFPFCPRDCSIWRLILLCTKIGELWEICMMRIPYSLALNRVTV